MERTNDWKSTYSGATFLFIGEGNFSFSASLAASPTFQSLNCQLIATDYAPECNLELETNEGEGSEIAESTPNEDMGTKKVKLKGESFNMTFTKQNLKSLRALNHPVFLDVNAVKLHEHAKLLSYLTSKRDRLIIIFNFPHVKSKKMKIGLNRDLLRDFFISCDKLYDLLSLENNEIKEFEITPIVSLCAGQSGINEVESLPRSWGDSWQINDMAAHGNFVCTDISKFDDWNLLKLTKEASKVENGNSSAFTGNSYQSSLYRLQSGTSFTTENALTLTYSRRNPIDPSETTRLQSIFIFSEGLAERNEKEKAFRQAFPDISEEKVIAAYEDNFANYSATSRPYLHIISVNLIDLNNILKYFEDSKWTMVKAIRIDEKLNNDVVIEYSRIGEKQSLESETRIIGIVKNESLLLFIDKLIELKHNCDYRHALCDSSAKVSLHPVSHEFHISFWISNKFTMNSFMEVLLDVYGLMLKSLEFVEEYCDEKEGMKRKSLCWKVQIQSLDLALSRQLAHQMYLQLRKELTERLNVIVR